MGRPVRSEVDRPANSRLLTPGSVVRIPVGFVWIGIVAMVMLLIGAYWMGANRGFDEGRAEGQEVVKSMEEVERTDNLRREPGASAPRTASAAGLPARERPSETRPAASSIPKKTGPGRPSGASSVDVEDEQRDEGWSYMVVLYTKLESAREVAESIRANGIDLGVDAMVEADENGRLASVILLPGSPEPFTAAEMTAWDRRIDELAERIADEPVWRGKRPLTGYYAETFGG